jgi:3-methyladenine DNA glycosylase AlkD
LLLHDEQDLIQKAVGWMLREIGKRCDQLQLLKFLDTYAAEMPRTMLRYSIEHLTPAQKKMYMGAAKKAAS